MNNVVVKNPGKTELSNAEKAAGQEEQTNELLSFTSQRTKLNSLVNDWESIREKAKENRKTRDLDFSVEVLRREGVLAEDEMLTISRTHVVLLSFSVCLILTCRLINWNLSLLVE